MPPKQRREEHRLFYQVLGVEPSATPAEVQRAYKLRALKVHPDKNPGDPGAADAFRQLRRAYETLGDPERRRRYDELGEDGEEDAEATRELVRTRFRPVTVEEIVEFERTYKGSDEERDDVAAFVRSRAGDVTDLLEHALCSEPEDVDRLLALVEELLRAGAVPEKLRAAVARSTPKLRRKAGVLGRRSARERRELEESRTAIGDVPGSLEDLALAIKGRQLQRARAVNDFAEGVAAKVAANAVRKRPAGSVEAKEVAKTPRAAGARS
mmetsp:Transcript_96633/g.288538  ORF Transcript_96633/g.288538 Transcript_96633/m.288538 type:complete len:268 (-) Transcript_96633:115-918(-)